MAMKTQDKYKKPLTFAVLFALLFLSACSALQVVETASQAIDSLPAVGGINTATPAPTATPGTLDKIITEVADTTGANDISALGLTGEDWINVGISLFLVFAGNLLGTIFAHVVLRILVRRTDIEFEDTFLKATGSLLRLLIVILSLQFSTTRLTFISSYFQALASNIYLITEWLIILSIIWKLIDFFSQWYRQKLVDAGGNEELDPLITLIRRMLLILLVVIGVSAIMSRFGLNTSVMTITIGIILLGLFLAAQDTITDAISGFIILADRPFRVGDLIEVDRVDGSGIVQEIGLRTTRVLTYDNRLVVIPNSIIGKSLVVNYTYPDPRYRVETRLQIAYGTDIKRARHVILDAIQQVEGVITTDLEKKSEVLCQEIDYSMVFRIWWWIDNYDDAPVIRDSVIEAIQNALIENNIQIASPALNVKITPEMVESLSESTRAGDKK
jgi:small-conductance mechanosensitive channel